MEDFIGITLRISLMYLYVLAILRFSGKRSIGDLSSLDFVVTTIIGDMFDDVFWAEIPVSKGIVGITTIVLLHTLVAYASYKSDIIRNLVSSKETLLVRSGRFKKEGLRAERMREETVYSLLRLHNEDKLKEVERAYLEPSGRVSNLKLLEYKPVQKQDLPELEKAVK